MYNNQMDQICYGTNPANQLRWQDFRHLRKQVIWALFILKEND